MLPKEKELNTSLTCLYLELDESIVVDLTAKVKSALDERSLQAQKVLELQLFLQEKFPNEIQTGEHVVDIAKKLLHDKLELTPEEVEVNQRLLFLIHKEFTENHTTFDGSFGEWLELRGLEFEEDRFTPILTAVEKQG